jgi:hypothetical protein
VKNRSFCGRSMYRKNSGNFTCGNS